MSGPVEALPAGLVSGLAARLAALEAEKAVRACLTRYMTLCDDLGEGCDLAPILALFTADAVWEGSGRYAASFGRREGLDAIRALFAPYTRSPAHFRLNVHFLTGEDIVADAGAGAAEGRWVMAQASTFASGASQLSCARLTVRFRRCDDGVWRMAHFQTHRLFSRPMAAPWDAPADLPVPE